MTYPEFDRFAVRMESLSERNNKKFIADDHVAADAPPPPLPDESARLIDELAGRMRRARESNAAIVMAFGAHAIKNGLGPVFLRLVEEGWVTHLCTNGAGIIHDWEFAFQGKSCEDVKQMVHEGRFGNWQETGFFINLALNVGAFEGRGYGESIGAMIENEGLHIPARDELKQIAARAFDEEPTIAAAAADLAYIVERFELAPGRLAIPHPWKQFSVQAGAFRARIPFTGHPMI